MAKRDPRMDLEATILGLFLRSEEAFQRAATLGITDESFEVERHRLIFKLMADLDRLRVPIEITSVATRLPAHENPAYLVDLLEQAPVAQSYEYYIRELLAASWRERTASSLLALGKRMATAKNAQEISTVQAECEGMLASIVSGGSPVDTATPTAAETVKRFEEQLEKRIVDHRAGGRRGIRTGMKCLDDHLGGWIPGGYYILGARTSLGKTTLAVNFLQAALADGRWVAFFTNEMMDYDIFGKLVSRRTKIWGSRIHTGDLSEPQIDYISRTCAELEREKLGINYRAGRRWETFSAECRRLRRAGRLDIVVQDYVQQMRWPSRKWTSRNDELTEISAGMKDLALDLEIPVITLAQLNRNAEKAGEKGGVPSVADLKDCGGLEQDADAIILIHRPREEGVAGGNYLIVGKNRFGKVGHFQVATNLAENVFSDEQFNVETT